jgi:putative MFS transporter
MENPVVPPQTQRLLNAAVIVAALGYFVDIYDLLLFIVVGRESLLELYGPGVDKSFIQLKTTLLLDVQMIGMLLGGILWGVLGDKKGRLSVLFGSIFLYSAANVANAFVQNEAQYIACRFLAGIGLAGELGAGITLVSEILPPKRRGYGTMIVASVGLTGAIAAGFVGNLTGWRTSFFIGGALGLALLLLRIGVSESGMFHRAKGEEGVEKGNFFALFAHRERLGRYLACIFLGLPTWFVVGILVKDSPHFAELLGVQHFETIKSGTTVMFAYAGLVVGDLLSGLLSQFWQSRKKVMAMFLLANLVVSLAVVNLYGVSPAFFYFMYFVLGVSVGFWVVFVSMAAEQFGTNLRATVTTTVPNFNRGALVPLSILFLFLKDQTGSMITAAMIVSVFCSAVGLLCLSRLRETFGRDLNFLE